MKKIFQIIIITLLVFFTKTSDYKILASNPSLPGSNIGAGRTSKYGSCNKNGNTFCWYHRFNTGGEIMQAIRVTIVDKNGNRLSNTKSVDYIKYDTPESKKFYKNLENSQYLNYYEYPNYKNAIVSENSHFRSKKTSGNYVSDKASPNHTIVLMDDKNTALPRYIIDDDPSAINDIIKPYFMRITSKSDGMFDKFFKPTFLDKLGYDLDKAYKNEDYKNHALLIEPIVYLRLTSDRPWAQWRLYYVGTVTEIAKMLSTSTADDCKGRGVFYDLFFDGKNTNGYCGGYIMRTHPFIKTFPLSIYATESGWGLNEVDPNRKKNYTTNVLTKDAVAAGHVWLGNIIEENYCPPPDKVTLDDLPLCCDVLIENNKINSTNASKCCPVMEKGTSLYRRYCEKCNWKIDITCPNNCYNTTNGSVKDMGNNEGEWECIFRSPDSKYPEVKDHFLANENQYCQIFCREEVNYQLPANGFSVQAGYHFTVGHSEDRFTWAPIVFKSKTECRTTSDTEKIKYDQFEKDYKKINDELPALWNKYRANSTQANLNAFNAKKKARDKLLKDLKECNNWVNNNDNFSPIVSVNYEEDDYGSPTIKLKTDSSAVDKSVEYYSGKNSSTDNRKFIKEINSYNCSGNKPCTNGTEKYPVRDKVIRTTNRTVTYELPGNTFRYINKLNGFSSTSKPASEYVDIGYGNLPVHYMRKSGDYDISLEYSTLGNKHKFNKYVFSGNSFGGVSTPKCSKTYQCKYSVSNRIITTENNLNVVFRPISLSNPFPGIDGKGRTPGSNWKNHLSVITNNRSLSDPERIFFDREPMYQITLTPQLIRNIRDYNRKQVGGYGDFNLTCKDGTGRECRSKFIRDAYRSYFSGCGINNNWKACS